MIPGLPWLPGRAAATPCQVALRVGRETLDWQALAAAVGRRAAHWQAAGVLPGDAVAALLPNGRVFLEGLHAAAARRAVWLPLNVRLAVPELAAQLRDAGARWLLHDDPRRDPRVPELVRHLPELRLLEADSPLSDRGPGGAPTPGAQPDAVRVLLYTSGTTGRPKGVELTHANFHANAVATRRRLGRACGQRWLACLPLFHVGGLAILTRSVLLGGSVVVHERFDAEAVSRALDVEGITGTSLVPTMLARLLEARGDASAPATLRVVLLGGGPVAPELLARAWRGGWPVAPSYGLTEATSQVATLPRSAFGARTDVAGRALPGLTLRIADGDGRPLPAGREGEILVRGPTVMAGYRNRPEETARVLRSGWLRTGDVGVLDREGWLRVLARRRDLIVTGGENVYPAEVEAALLAHPEVREAGVAPAPDREFGQRVEAWVVLRPGARANVEGIRAFCRTRLAGYKVPRAVHLVSELPRTAAGKLLRRALPERPGA